MSVRQLVGSVHVWHCDTCGRETVVAPDATYASPPEWLWIELRGGRRSADMLQPTQADYCSLACAQVGTLTMIAAGLRP